MTLSERAEVYRAALQRLVDGGDCECDDHLSEDCCAYHETYRCPECIAAQALSIAEGGTREPKEKA